MKITKNDVAWYDEVDYNRLAEAEQERYEDIAFEVDMIVREHSIRFCPICKSSLGMVSAEPDIGIMSGFCEWHSDEEETAFLKNPDNREKFASKNRCSGEYYLDYNYYCLEPHEFIMFQNIGVYFSMLCDFDLMEIETGKDKKESLYVSATIGYADFRKLIPYLV